MPLGLELEAVRVGFQVPSEVVTSDVQRCLLLHLATL